MKKILRVQMQEKEKYENQIHDLQALEEKLEKIMNKITIAYLVTIQQITTDNGYPQEEFR